MRTIPYDPPKFVRRSTDAATPRDAETGQLVASNSYPKASERGLSSKADLAEAENYIVNDPSESIGLKFARLSSIWKKESAHLSSVERMSLLPSYQAIIGMGSAVVPFLLKELQKEPGHWFWALHAITQENPAEGEGHLRVPDLANLWIAWGRRKGLV